MDLRCLAVERVSPRARQTVFDNRNIPNIPGVVLRMVLRGFDLTRDASYIGHACGPTAVHLRRLLQQRQKAHGRKVALRDIRAVHIIPILERRLLILKQVLLHLLRRAGLGLEGLGRDAGVVDQDVEALLLGRNLLVHFGDFVLFRDVAGDGDDLAADALAVGLRDLVQLLPCAAADVHFGAVDG